jgi:hypothetical protein
VGLLVDDPSSMERRRGLQRSTVQAAADTVPVQRGGTSVPASDRKASPRSRSPENLSAPDPPAPPPASPIRHPSDGVPAGEAVRRVEWETGAASIQGPRAIFPRPAPPAAPASASATPSGDPVRQEGRRGQSHPHYSIYPPGLHQFNPQRISDGRQPQDGSRAPPKLTGPVKPGHFARIEPSPPQRQSLRAGSAVRSCSPGTDLESPAESPIHCPENSAPPLQDMLLHHPCLRADRRLDDHRRRFGLLVGSQSPEGGERDGGYRAGIRRNEQRASETGHGFSGVRFRLAATTKSQDKPR